MKKRFCILDCYVDEPACLGVPPFISPYPRYIFGALADAGVDENRIRYLTIDALRESDYHLDSGYDMVFLIGGASVPGRYLGSKIGTLAEIRRIIERNHGQGFAVGGPVGRVVGNKPGSLPVASDIEKFAHAYALGDPSDSRRSVRDIASWAVLGARVVELHPRYPDLICEIETYRGCPRLSHCSFCAEGIFGTVEYRESEDIIAEVDALIAKGITRFRLGRQADILQYKCDFSSFTGGFPRPRPQPILDLLSGLGERKAKGYIKTLNIDNANPGTIVHYPDEASRILEGIVAAVTPGDTMALGVESFDPRVMAENNLKVSGDGALKAIEMINLIGGARVKSIPVLLPGLNLLHGLPGESIATFEENYRWLLKILDMGLLLKRINIRQVVPFPGTPLFNNRAAPPRAVVHRFTYYRDRIRFDIEHRMLQRIYPVGTVIRDNQIMELRAGYSYGKQISSYSITVKFPMALPVKSFHDAVVVGHGERSLIVLPNPIPINTLPHRAIELIPGIGKKKASDVVLNRPFAEMADAFKILEGVEQAITGKLSLL
jgi:radical SAM superfamily enzyme with C-terminal helix-hairpin-helix motif